MAKTREAASRPDTQPSPADATSVAPSVAPDVEPIAAAMQHPDVVSYVSGVLDGSIIAGQLIKLACQRFIEDVQAGAERGLWFDEAMAWRAIDFIENLKHSKGKWKGQPLKLEPWQAFIVWQLFGWYTADGHRRFQRAYVEVARKNGKSTLGAALALLLAFCDSEGGAEVYCAATKRDQAMIVFTEAKRMVKSSGLSRILGLEKYRISLGPAEQILLPLGSDADSTDGLNVHGAIVDELHAHRTDGMWSVLDTATGARDHPMIVAITTAGNNRSPSSICWQVREHARQVVEGISDDDQFFAAMYEPDKGDDWTKPSTWAKGNPNLGVSVSTRMMEIHCRRVRYMPAAALHFRQKLTNEWVASTFSWISPIRWDDCRFEIDDAELVGRRAFAGLDLPSRTDLGAFVLVFPPLEADEPYIVRPRFFIPSAAVAKRHVEGRGDFQAWADADLLTVTPGEIIRYEQVADVIAADCQRYDVADLAFDPWGAEQLIQSLEARQVDAEFIEFRQTPQNYTGPMRRLEEALVERTIGHDGHPVLGWCIGNVRAQRDAKDNVMPARKASPDKIDGAVAMLMAWARAIMDEGPVDTSSIYDDAGPMII